MAKHSHPAWLLTVTLLLGSALLPQAALATIRLGVSDWPGWVAWYIADRNGYFARHGAQVELLWFDRYTDSVRALQEGQLDANSQSWGDTLPLLAAGHKLQLILLNDTSAGNDALLAAPGIAEIAQLRGKRIALEVASPSHLLLDAALQQHGIGMNEVTLVNMPASDAASALENGQVDAAVSWSPWLDKALKGGRTKRLFDSSQLPGLISHALVARSDRLLTSEQRQEFIGVIRAWFDTVTFVREYPDAAAGIMAKVIEVNPDDYRLLLPGIHFFAADENLSYLTAQADQYSLQLTTRRLIDYFIRHRVIDEELDFRHAINQQLIRAAAWKSPK